MSQKCVDIDKTVFFIVVFIGALLFIDPVLGKHSPKKSKLCLPTKPPKRFKRESTYSDDIQTEELVPGRYWIYKSNVNWSMAFCYCAMNGLQLASLADKKDFRTVIFALFKLSRYNSGSANNEGEHELWLGRSYWVGITDIMEEGTWQPVGRYEPLHDAYFWQYGEPGHPGNGLPEHCVQLANLCYNKNSPSIKRIYTHRFHDVRCNTKLYFICETADMEPPTLPPQFGTCPGNNDASEKPNVGSQPPANGTKLGRSSLHLLDLNTEDSDENLHGGNPMAEIIPISMSGFHGGNPIVKEGFHGGNSKRKGRLNPLATARKSGKFINVHDKLKKPTGTGSKATALISHALRYPNATRVNNHMRFLRKQGRRVHHQIPKHN